MAEQPQSLADRLRWLREQRFGSRGRAAIAKLVGVAGNTWKAYEERGVAPTAPVLARLLSAMPDLSPLWLILGKGEPFPSNAPIREAPARTDTSQLTSEEFLSKVQKAMAKAMRTMATLVEETEEAAEMLRRLENDRRKKEQ